MEKEPTRFQKRAIQRVKEDAEQTLNALLTKLDRAFINEDFEDLEGVIAELNAKWITYCKRKGLVPGVYPSFKESANQMIEIFKEELKNQEPEVDKLVDMGVEDTK